MCLRVEFVRKLLSQVVLRKFSYTFRTCSSREPPKNKDVCAIMVLSKRVSSQKFSKTQKMRDMISADVARSSAQRSLPWLHFLFVNEKTKQLAWFEAKVRLGNEDRQKCVHM